MATDYASIENENIRRFGTDIGELGELFFSQLYTERTHFIYELLQNAEDALQRRSFAFPMDTFSRHVKFRLFADRLELSHCGIPFNEKDVRGICGILRGTKGGDLTQIGRFGIGFKSVYVYTTTPHIHSGGEHFRIRDFVKPQGIPPDQRSADETLFILPFDRSEASREAAFQEIAAGLETLSVRILLFLRHIDQIVWEVENGKQAAYRRESQSLSQSTRKVVLREYTGKENGPEEWLVFHRPVRADSGKELPVEIAFLLGKEQNGRRTLIPLNGSNLVVFFPTDKETHLGMLVQGPYRTTLSRDNVPSDDPWNSTLISETAILLADSLSDLRDSGFMNMDLLKALPTCEGDFPESFMFRPLFDEVRGAFLKTDLLPNSDGLYRPAPKLKLARPGGLRELLSNQQLTQLCASEDPIEWLHEELSGDRNHSVYEYLTDELDIKVVTPSDVAQLLSRQFLEVQSDDWVIRFYAFLQEQEALWREGTRWKAPGLLRNKPIIRLESGAHVPPFTEDGLAQAYLPGEHKSHFPIVKRIIAEDKDVLAFLRRLGLRKPDATAEVVDYILPRYRQPTTWRTNDDNVMEDLKLIIEACRTDSSKAKERLQEQLKTSYFIPTLNPSTGEHILTRPDETYFPSVELETYFLGSDSVRFAQQILPPGIHDEFDGILRSLGVAAEPRRIEFAPDVKWAERARLRNGTGITASRGERLRDYDLDGLNAFLNRMDGLSTELAVAHGKILWNFLRRHENENGWFLGSYSWFHYSSWSADFPAKFLRALREEPWLPRRDGKLCRPTELTINELPEDFQKSRKLSEHLGMKPDNLGEIAAQLNVDEESLALLREHPEEWKQFIRQLNRVQDAPGDSPLAPQQRDAVIERDSGFPALSEEPTSDMASSEEISADESGQNKSVVHDSKDASESAKWLPVIVGSGETDGREHQASAGPDNIAARAGVEKVLQYEVDHGRQPEEMTHTNEGFDIKSWDPVKKVMRYIEVKSPTKEWGEATVALSAPQFRFGMNIVQGQEFWLYVVERAGSEDARIRCIPDPARRTTNFVFPAGWSRLVVDESSDHNLLRKGTTLPGFVNPKGQEVVRNTGKPGTDHAQYVYEMKCRHCGCHYGANGSDIHARNCPACQGGKPGLSL